MKKHLSWIVVLLFCTEISFANETVDTSRYTQSNAQQKTNDMIHSEAYIMNAFASELYINKGITRIKERNYQLAISDFYEAIRLNPGSYEAYRLIGEANTASNKITEALNAFDKSIDLNPFYAEAYFQKAFLLHKQGDFQKAYENYSIAMYIDPIYIHGFVKKDLDALSFCNFMQKNQGLNVSKK